MVEKMEHILGLTDISHRKLIRFGLDAGFGTDENIDYALWRGYHLLVKMYSGKRAKKLANSVKEWVDISPSSDNNSRQADNRTSSLQQKDKAVIHTHNER